MLEFAQGYGPHRQPLELAVLDQVARGAADVPSVSAALRADPYQVADAVSWAVEEGLLSRMLLTESEHLTLTAGGLASVAWQRRLSEAVDAEGRIDVDAITRDVASAQRAALEGEAAAIERSHAHVLVDDAERDAATAELARHFAEGAIDRSELERRTELALQARTRGDLGEALAALEGEREAGLGGRQVVSLTATRRAVGLVKIAFLLIFLTALTSMILRQA